MTASPASSATTLSSSDSPAGKGTAAPASASVAQPPSACDPPRPNAVAAASLAGVTCAAAAAAVAAARQEAELRERTRQLEENSQRLRENAERLRTDNRRARIFGAGSVGEACSGSPMSIGSASLSASSPYIRADIPTGEENVDITTAAQRSFASSLTPEAARRMEEMRRKIAELDEINALEKKRLEEEERMVEERRRAQEEFERSVQEHTEREIREHHQQEARKAQLRAQREDHERQEREERERKRREQLEHQEQESRRREEQRQEGRSEASQLKWQAFEEELERQWAEQEAEEKRHIGEYARDRRRQYEDWDRQLASERHRFAPEAAYCQATYDHQKMRNAARADDQFYASRRSSGNTQSSPRPSPRQTGTSVPKPPPQAKNGGGGAATNALGADMRNLTSEERGVLKELQSVSGSSRELQKAKVKDLLFRWHPDKNPACVEKATKIFQFVQKQREVVLGL